MVIYCIVNLRDRDKTVDKYLENLDSSYQGKHNEIRICNDNEHTLYCLGVGSQLSLYHHKH